MSEYLKITKKELEALMEISESTIAMCGSGNESFDIEAQEGRNAIDSILKRNGLKRKPYVNEIFKY